MKDRPNTANNVVSRDAAFGHEEEIGKEAGHAHMLLCRLRQAGATRGDLIKMRGSGHEEAFEEFIAKVRGIRIPCEHDNNGLPLINLDCEPWIEDLVELPSPILTGATRTIRDLRLGMWPVEDTDGNLVFGDMKFAVEKVSGTCVVGTSFCSGNLKDISSPGHHMHANLAMARWFSKGGRIDIPFDDSKLFQPKLNSESILFLGTVWWESDTRNYWAPALTAYKKGAIKLEIRPIPKGEWPKNCYVALLVPK